MRTAIIPLVALLALTGCDNSGPMAGAPAPTPAPPLPELPKPATATAPSPNDPVEPPAPGSPGGLPDDRTPISEAPFPPQSAQGAANVVQTYAALLETGRYGDAWRLWGDGGKASGLTEAAFKDSFGKYAQYHANVGAPGLIEGAAGSLYVEVTMQAYGRLLSGEPFVMIGPVRLKRVNDVPGATAEQRAWHIVETDLKVVPRP